jgi:hypothetical protein
MWSTVSGSILCHCPYSETCLYSVHFWHSLSLLQISYRLENRRRDRLYGKPIADATVDTTELADEVCQRVARNYLVLHAHRLTRPFTGPCVPLRSIKCLMCSADTQTTLRDIRLHLENAALQMTTSCRYPSGSWIASYIWTKHWKVYWPEALMRKGHYFCPVVQAEALSGWQLTAVFSSACLTTRGCHGRERVLLVESSAFLKDKRSSLSWSLLFNFTLFSLISSAIRFLECVNARAPVSSLAWFSTDLTLLPRLANVLKSCRKIVSYQ